MAITTIDLARGLTRDLAKFIKAYQQNAEAAEKQARAQQQMAKELTKIRRIMQLSERSNLMEKKLPPPEILLRDAWDDEEESGDQ